MASVPLIRNVDGKWELQPEGIEVMQSVKQPMQVIAVAGMYRTGKSYFLNVLAGNVGQRAKGGFGVGSTSEAKTRGIDVLVARNNSAGSLVLLDTEGLASMEQDESYDAQIFGLGLLLSSFFVLNSMGVIDEAAIDRFYLIAELSKYIVVSASGEGDEAQALTNQSTNEELSQHFPPFLWLLRDFVVEMTTNGAQISEQTYLEKALESRPGNQRRATERNETRAAIRSLFPSRRCVTLVRPTAEEADLRNAVNLPEDKLRPEFTEKIRKLRQDILDEAPAKTVYGEKLDGAMLLSLASRYLASMNAPGTLPCIKSAWEGVVDERNRKAADNALAEATTDLSDAVKRSPLPDGAEWAEISLKSYDKAICAFEQNVVQGVQAVPVREGLRKALLALAETQCAHLWTASKENVERASEKAGRTLPNPPEAGQAADAIGQVLAACDDESQGPLAASAVALCCQRAVVPWLQSAEAAAEKERSAVAQAAKEQVHELESKIADLRGELGVERQRAEALQASFEQEQRRREEEVASWQERHQKLSDTLDETQADLKATEAKHAEVSTAHAAELQRSAALTQQVEQEQARREEECASWKNRHDEVTRLHQEAETALKASEVKASDLAGELGVERQRSEALQSNVEQEQQRRKEEGADWQQRHKQLSEAHADTQAALKSSEAKHAEASAAHAAEVQRSASLQTQIEQEQARREEEGASWKTRHEEATRLHLEAEASLKASEIKNSELAGELGVERQRSETLLSNVEQEQRRREEEGNAWKSRHEEATRLHLETDGKLKASEAKTSDLARELAVEQQRCESVQASREEEQRRREDEVAGWKDRHKQLSDAHAETQASLKAVESKHAEVSLAHATEQTRTAALQQQVEQEQRRREDECASWKTRHEEVTRLHSETQGQLKESEAKHAELSRDHAAEKLRTENLQNQVKQEQERREEELKAAAQTTKQQVEALESKISGVSSELALERQRSETLQSGFEQEQKRREEELGSWQERHKQLSDAHREAQDALKAAEARHVEASTAHASAQERAATLQQQVAEEQRRRDEECASWQRRHEDLSRELGQARTSSSAAEDQHAAELASHKQQLADLQATLEQARATEAKALAARESAQSESTLTQQVLQEACDEFMQEEVAKRDARIKELEGQLQNFGVLAGGAVGMGIGAVVGAFHHVFHKIDTVICKGECVPKWNDHFQRLHVDKRKKHSVMLKEKKGAWEADGIVRSSKAGSAGVTALPAGYDAAVVVASAPCSPDSAAGPATYLPMPPAPTAAVAE